MDVSFGSVWEAVARRLPDAVALCEPGREFTYARFEDRSARLATALVAAGVGPGDKVACYLYNGAAYLETVFAAFKIGAVPVNANYRYTRDELSSLLRDADAAALVFSGELAGNVTDAARHVPTLRLLVRVGAASAGPAAAELEDVVRSLGPHPARPRPGSDQLFMYTGGTTGRPKGVIWRQADLLHSLLVPIFRPLGAEALPATLDEAVDIAVSAHAAGRAPVTMPVVPLMHGTGLFNSMGALLTGGQVVTTRRGRARSAPRLGDRRRTARRHDDRGGQRVVPSARRRADRRRAGGQAARPRLAAVGHQLGHGVERPPQARAARTGRGDGRGRDRLDRRRPVRLRGHLIGRRPACPVLSGAGDEGAHARGRAGRAGQRADRGARVRRADAAGVPQGRGQDLGHVPRRRRCPVHGAR